jgi:hypothetical protein
MLGIDASSGLHQPLSHNGTPTEPCAKHEGIAGPAQHDRHPFQVDWDDGHEHNVSPMKFSGAKKWLIVFVIAHVSLCVSVTWR